MKALFVIIGSLLILSACTKDKSECIAKSADGTSLFEVVGKDNCEDQISSANGEYCNCVD